MGANLVESKKKIAELDQIQLIASKFYEILKPCKIYLFGSFVRGDQNADSDYDFYVVVHDDNYADDLELKARKTLWGTKRRPVDVIVTSKSRFAERLSKGFSFEKTVLGEGVVLYAQ